MNKISWRAIAARAALALGGLAFAALLILLLVRLFPDLEPGGQRIIFTAYDGDTFRHQPGQVRPPLENVTLEDLILRHDADGFRRPRMTAGHYPIIALGDSFTDGGQVPWVDVLAETLDIPVRNLGRSGFGPLEYLRVMETYGGSGHDWVLVGYFEGNDLSNIHTAYQQIQTDGELVIQVIQPPGEHSGESNIVTNPEDNYLYPLRHNINGEVIELAYISDYLWWLNAPEATYRESENMRLLGEALTGIRDLAGEACVALVYMPDKGHIYFRYSDPEGNRRYVMENARTPFLTGDGWIDLSGLAPGDVDVLLANLDNQRNVVREVTVAAGLHFIDLVPGFEAAAESSQPSYYTYDSHWNERGHRIAGEAIADYIRGVEGCGPGGVYSN